MSRSSANGDGSGRAGVQSTSAASSSTLTEKYRRNGRLQSCESCRKSKLRCDHVVPACGRCVKRGKASQCFYHPNPLTQQVPSQRPVPNPLVVWARQQHRGAGDRGRPGGFISTGASMLDGRVGSLRHSRRWNAHSSPTTRCQPHPAASLPSPISSSSQVSPKATLDSVEIPGDALRALPPTVGADTNGSTHAHCQPFHRAASAPPLDYQRPPDVRRNTGFQGPTSNFTILTEGLGILEPDPSGLESIEQQEDIVVTSARITQGCNVLSFFENRNIVAGFMDRWHGSYEGTDTMLISTISKEWLEQLWLFHADTLTSGDPVRIQKLSERIWRNTLVPLEFDGDTTIVEYARLGSGLNLRWEVLGLIASCIGLAVIEAPISDPIFAAIGVSRSCVIGKMREIAEKCLVFCRYCEVLDDMFIWLLVEYSSLIYALKGSRHYATYRTTGEAHSAVVAMGLHQNVKASERVPFFLAELRKRAFTVAYFQEIGLAVILGRPPRLSYRYCHMEAPLDLTEAQLVQTGADLAATLASSLDDDGYNTVGNLHPQTIFRACVDCIMRREDIVDLALGQYTREEILERARVIEEKTERHFASLPAFLQKYYSDPVEFIVGSQIKPLVALQLGAMRSSSRSNELLLQRVLIRKTGASSERLTRVARAVFHDVLQVTQRHDLASQFQASYNAYLSGHGLRSAAIVAIELLKQDMLPQYPERPTLPRSQTIQELAVFAARLATVDPSDGCYNLCEQGNRVISKILDRILSPQGARQDKGPACQDPAARAQAQVQAQAAAVSGGAGNGGGGGEGQQHQGLPQCQMDTDVTMTTIGPPFNPTMVAMPSDFPGYDMMDIGIGIEAPTSLGQDMDFMRWLEGMNWERMENWTM